MDSFYCEILPYFQSPSPDARLVFFCDEEIIHSSRLAVHKHLQLCSEYAQKHSLYLVSGLLEHNENLCLCLFGPDGRMLCRQPALHLSMAMAARIKPGDRMQVTHTQLGNLALCVDVDVFHPQCARAAALKGADLLLSVQHLDPVDDTPERLMCSVWNAAQTNNLYVINLSGRSTTVTCPAPLTRHQDGYLVRRTSCVPTRFALNVDRLDEVRAGFPLLERVNTQLMQGHAQELRRCLR